MPRRKKHVHNNQQAKRTRHRNTIKRIGKKYATSDTRFFETEFTKIITKPFNAIRRKL